MEKSEAIIAVLLVIAIVASIASMVIMNNKIALTGKATGTGQVNATINSRVTFILTHTPVDFGAVDQGTTHATDKAGSTGPYPFHIENNGTENLNITVNAGSALFKSSTNGYFKYSSEDEESGSGAAYVSSTAFTPTTEQPLVSNLTALDSADTMWTQIQIQVPSDELAGTKTSSLTFTASAT